MIMVEQMSLFDDHKVYNPLASRLRPEDLNGFVGQEHLLERGELLRQLIEQNKVPYIILWGSPGVGKTTLAGIIAHRTHAQLINFSAATSGIKEIRDVMAQAENSRRVGIKTVVFVDEIHRSSKAQQDAFLPCVEKGGIILVGTTTENPSFEINGALLSQRRVFVLQALIQEGLTSLLKIVIHSEKGLGYLSVDTSDHMLDMIAMFATRDAKTALNTLEMAVTNGEINADKTTVTMEALEQHIGEKSFLYNKKGEEYYNIISALHKSMHNADPDVAVYWLARMLEAGENPLYVTRRLIRFASEDIEMADSRALPLTVITYEACYFLGMPECNVHLSYAVIYLSVVPKSNSAYVVYNATKEDAQAIMAETVPPNIRNTPTKLMEELYYGNGYVCAHDAEQKMARTQCLPGGLLGRTCYHPHGWGGEPKVKRRLDEVKVWKTGQ